MPKRSNGFPKHLENMAADIYVSVVDIVNRRLNKLLSAYKSDPVVNHLQKILRTDSDEDQRSKRLDNFGKFIHTDSLRSEIEKFLYGQNALTEKELRALERKFGRLDTSTKAFAANSLNNSIDKMKVELKNKKRYKFNLEQSLDSAEITGIRSGFMSQNLRLAEMLGNEYMAEIGQSAFNAFLEGTSLEDLADKFQELKDINESKAEFWGRDQLGDAYAEYTKEMHTNAGIERYIWRDAGDNHVRGKEPGDKTDHHQLNGKVFNWTEGASKVPDAFSKPGAKNPGEDYQCRCIAEPTEKEETNLEEIEE